MKYPNIREEELKNKVGADFFAAYDTTQTVGNIDFCVAPPSPSGRVGEGITLLWAEAKRGSFDLVTMFAQLILTIGKARTFDKFLPPAFLGAFDAQKIGFVPYNSVLDIFSMNDFNWNVTPSNHDSKEFKIIKDRIEKSLQENHYQYDFIKDDDALRFFIKNNIARATESGKILIDKNNFVPIYLRWLDQVKPHINFDWAEGKKQNIHDNDFYLADLFVDDKGTSAIEDDTPLNDNLFVVFRNSHYEIAKENLKSLFNASIELNNKLDYEQFWKKYKRPPLEEFQQHIIMRKDLLVPQDIRERKGAFFTPKQWVALSQQYIATTLGENWQDEYYVWDCAAGTGNLLAGLTNKYNIWASTLDQSDVNAMHDRIANGAILLKDHCFQFDFLNDDFSKLPQALQNIINDPEKRKKLVIYINPPYAEGGSTKHKESKVGVSNETLSHRKYFDKMSTFSKRELYVQFLMRIYVEIPGCTITNFSTLKNLQSSYFSEFRNFFRARLEKLFVVPADTFDNVKGKFPIGFFVWDTNKSELFEGIIADVFNHNGDLIDNKVIFSYDNLKYLNDWLRPTWKDTTNEIGFLACNSNDFQNQNGIFIEINKKNETSTYFKPINSNNLVQSSIYFAVRHCIEATWLNDRDQFLYPNDSWQTDKEFQNDCLAFTLFSNNIQSKYGINHWIPFTENEVNAKEKFDSNFMTDFIKGKIKVEVKDTVAQLFAAAAPLSKFETLPKVDQLQFSEAATAVFDAGRQLWQYYHHTINANKVVPPSGVRGLVNASLYDIREYFQGRNPAGKMNNKSQDETYMKLITDLRQNLKVLAKKIEPKVYEYGFLKA